MREIVVTPRALALLYREKDGGAVRLYLYYLSSGALEPGEAMAALDMTREEYAAAYARLVALELLPSPRRLPEETPPSYTREEIAGTVESDREFRELLAFTEQKLGRIASNHEVEILLSLYHWLGLPCEVLMLIVSYTAERVAEEGGRAVSTCTCLIVPNLTHMQRPYALIENVVTDAAYRNRGLASACLARAKEIAIQENCYKLMLMTGSKEQKTLDFYAHAGYSSLDKTAFVQWLE